MKIFLLMRKSYQTTMLMKEYEKKFQFILECILVITNSLLTGALADYWLYKTTDTEGWVEILGITGGIIKIFQIINNTISRTMLKCLKKMYKKGK